ncbi:hypothetical protein PPERSA_01220 [Pseudocohnilembus persalinus]|uniref:fructose-bisphosphatase n=1 Tax=Pseudocohnilembus persalinus TaxID=266149 RepID=A0A0V0R946_PSEPJ|nr:hypothetical protein PPERSA_01220 [Pseudocohnilembus persalinus]|eukprot:KRX11021.1 hypothetical protein PPERSA_01220 [Pseudocohnilembus persalinus]
MDKQNKIDLQRQESQDSCISNEEGGNFSKEKERINQEYQDGYNSPGNNFQLQNNARIVNGSMNMFSKKILDEKSKQQNEQEQKSHQNQQNQAQYVNQIVKVQSKGSSPKLGLKNEQALGDNLDNIQAENVNFQGQSQKQSQAPNFISSSEDGEYDEEDEEEFLTDAQKRRQLFSVTGNFKPLEEPLTHQEHLEKYAEKFNLGSDFVDLMQAMEKTVLEVRKIIQKAHKQTDIFDLQELVSETIQENLIESEAVAILQNTKTQQIIKVPQSQSGRFVISFCPLDVNKIEDVQQNCGFMFTVMKKISSSYKPANKQDFFQSGEKIDCAGYALFSQQTILVYHAGFRVNTYYLNKSKKCLELKFNNIKTPKRKGIMSYNSSEEDLFDKNLKVFLRRKMKRENDLEIYYQRHSGSKIAEFHRILLCGGIYMLPKHEGKPCLSDEDGGINFFEYLVFAYLIEKAWERNSTGVNGSVLLKKPLELNQRVSLFLGFGSEVQELENLYLEIRRQNSVYESLKKKNNNYNNSNNNNSQVQSEELKGAKPQLEVIQSLQSFTEFSQD